ncbi:hypothetical protein GW17_00021029 [Ensete ventricosum]|nr:hypothetical protein GW17_00021029 [Ensete ventricosum]
MTADASSDQPVCSGWRGLSCTIPCFATLSRTSTSNSLSSLYKPAWCGFEGALSHKPLCHSVLLPRACTSSTPRCHIAIEVLRRLLSTTLALRYHVDSKSTVGYCRVGDAIISVDGAGGRRGGILVCGFAIEDGVSAGRLGELHARPVPAHAVLPLGDPLVDGRDMAAAASPGGLPALVTLHLVAHPCPITDLCTTTLTSKLRYALTDSPMDDRFIAFHPRQSQNRES